MPLTPYLKEAVFGPREIEAMNAAFEATCKSLQLVDRHGPTSEVVARTIIDLARDGERDPQRMHDLALRALKRLDQRTA